MEQTMNLQARHACPHARPKLDKNAVRKSWEWIKWLFGGIATMMFVPSEVDRRIEESRERGRQLLIHGY
ncbi:MAG: hypothetical protein AB7G93_01120 [Bdellovibrionales bacterium]